MIAIAAGGTGGHMFPAEALAAELKQRGHRVVLFTDARSGARSSPVFGDGDIHVLSGAGLAGRGVLHGARAMAGLARGFAQARTVLSASRFGCVAAFGGYPAVAPVLAARTLSPRPAIVLHEQNAVLGRANRFLARFADRLALGFANTARLPTGIAVAVTGNPVRPAIAAIAGRVYVPWAERISLLVLGGSLGARIFSDAVPKAVAALPAPLRGRLRIVQQCRAEDLARVRAAYAGLGVDAELAPFFPDVADRLAAAHLLIARAGASTCAEVAAIGIPAILVPLPGAIDNHQAANAASLAADDGALLLPQADLDGDTLAAWLGNLLADPGMLARRAAGTARHGVPEAAAALADLVEREMETVR